MSLVNMLNRFWSRLNRRTSAAPDTPDPPSPISAQDRPSPPLNAAPIAADSQQEQALHGTLHAARDRLNAFGTSAAVLAYATAEDRWRRVQRQFLTQSPKAPFGNRTQSGISWRISVKDLHAILLTRGVVPPDTWGHSPSPIPPSKRSTRGTPPQKFAGEFSDAQSRLTEEHLQALASELDRLRGQARAEKKQLEDAVRSAETALAEYRRTHLVPIVDATGVASPIALSPAPTGHAPVRRPRDLRGRGRVDNKHARLAEPPLALKPLPTAGEWRLGVFDSDPDLIQYWIDPGPPDQVAAELAAYLSDDQRILPRNEARVLADAFLKRFLLLSPPLRTQRHKRIKGPPFDGWYAFRWRHWRCLACIVENRNICYVTVRNRRDAYFETIGRR